MKKAVLLALALIFLMADTLAAQRRGGGSAWAARPQHHGFAGGHPFYSRSLSYGNVFYGTPYLGFSYPGFGFYADPPGNNNNNNRYVIAEAPPIPLEKQIVYIPTYLRADPGPSLGELARALRAKKANRSP